MSDTRGNCITIHLILLTVIPTPYFKKYAKNISIKAFVDGITSAVIGALSGSNSHSRKYSHANHSVILDIPSVFIAVAVIFALIYIKKIQEPYIILIAAIIGIIIKTLL